MISILVGMSGVGKDSVGEYIQYTQLYTVNNTKQ